MRIQRRLRKASNEDLFSFKCRFTVKTSNFYMIDMNAVFLATSEDVPVNMRHILESLRMERLKMGKVMIPGDFQNTDTILKRKNRR